MRTLIRFSRVLFPASDDSDSSSDEDEDMEDLEAGDLDEDEEDEDLINPAFPGFEFEFWSWKIWK